MLKNDTLFKYLFCLGANMKPEEYEKYVDITGRKFIKYYVLWRLIEVSMAMLFIGIAFVVGYYVVLPNVMASVPKIAFE